jgi:hypothetical protein
MEDCPGKHGLFTMKGPKALVLNRMKTPVKKKR